MRAITPHLITNKPIPFTVRGDLAGAEVATLAERLWPHVLTGPPDTLVDLALATTIDAAGLDLLVAAHTYAAHRHIPLRIVNAAPRVLRVLHAAGVSAFPARSPRAEFATIPATTPALQQHTAAVVA